LTQVITTPDGVEHEFSDNASDDVIKKALRSYSKTPPPDVTGGAYTYDKGGGWQASLHNLAVKMNNATRTAQDAYLLHAPDAITSLLPGMPSAADLRAQTEASRKDLGPYAATAVDAAARIANPLSRVGGTGPLSLAASGAAQQGVGAALEGKDPQTIAAEAAAGGVTGGAIGTVGKYLATPTFASNLAKYFAPRAAAYGAGYLGGGHLAGGAAAMATHSILPGMEKVIPYANPWWNPMINAGVQGPLSGALSGQTP
jgi:hypothetical protein